MKRWPFTGDNVFLTGFMGAGKTTVGRALSEEVQATFVDLDVKTEAMLGVPIADAIRERGEEAFRRVETGALRDVARGRHQVVALGGGTLLSPANQSVANASGTVVWLRVSEATAFQRIGNVASRPLWKAGLLKRREQVYALAAITVDTDGLTVPAVVAAVVRALEAPL